MKKLTITALAAALFSLAAVAQTPVRLEGSNPQIIFNYGGTEADSICYRIPAIATVNAGPLAGRLIAINDFRYCGGDIGWGRIDLYQSVSDDNGRTWTAPGHLLDAQQNPIAQGDSSKEPTCAFGDAAIVADVNSPDVLILAVGGPTGFFAGRRQTPNYCFRFLSHDGGLTWERTDITEQILSLFDGEPEAGYIDAQFFGSGRIAQSRQIKAGTHNRIYAVLTSQNDGGRLTRNWCLYSDDFGLNWHILGNAPAVSTLADEPKAEELPDGNVLLAARGLRGNRNFNIFTYTDPASAAGSWSTSVNTDMGMGKINACDGEILILPATDLTDGSDLHIALQSFPYGGGRNNVSIAWRPLRSTADYDSPEDFTRWEGRMQLTDFPSAYSTMTLQNDGTIGFLYEESTFGRDYCGIYMNFPLETITQGKYKFK